MPQLPEESSPLLEQRRRVRRKQIVYHAIALAALVSTGLTIAYALLPSGHVSHDDPYVNIPGPQPGLRNPSYLVRGRQGAVATEVKECSEIGVGVLKDGGNAVDAAIAACLCIGVTNSFSAGIGGGGFMVVRPADGSHPISIDFRESSPIGARPNMFTNKPAWASKIGGLAVGVPGELRGLEAAYKLQGGRVSWKRLFEPSIKLAKAYTIGPELGRRLNKKNISGFIPQNPLWRRYFMRGGRMLKQGDVLSRPEYADTLKKIAQKGAEAFYKGPIAASIAQAVQEAGGILSVEDLATYEARVLPAVKGTYRNRTIWTAQAPSSGPILISLLNTLEPMHQYVEEGKTGLNVHRFIEAQKFAFAHRTELGDPAFTNNSAKWEHVVTKKLGYQTYEHITDNTTHTLPYYRAKFDLHDNHGTTHLTVVDTQGNAVSLTTTVNLLWGSRVMDPRTGVILNDEMDDFATPNVPDAFGLAPSPYNYPEGPRIRGEVGKRPLSSTAPTIIDNPDGSFWLALGGSGGSRIFGGVAQTILNLDWGYDLSHAIEEPRVHHQLLPAYVAIESGITPEILDALKVRGHNITLQDINLGMCEVQAVARSPDGWLYASSDSRKNGIPAAC